jgi:hypothetical protein
MGADERACRGARLGHVTARGWVGVTRAHIDAAPMWLLHAVWVLRQLPTAPAGCEPRWAELNCSRADTHWVCVCGAVADGPGDARLRHLNDIISSVLKASPETPWRLTQGHPSIAARWTRIFLAAAP